MRTNRTMPLGILQNVVEGFFLSAEGYVQKRRMSV